MSNFTPGPWVVRKHKFQGLCVHAPTIEAVCGCDYIVASDVNGDETADPTYGTPQANARLIAAAPDGLAFAQWIADRHPAGSVEGDKAREFIAKATVEQA